MAATPKRLHSFDSLLSAFCNFPAGFSKSFAHFARIILRTTIGGVMRPVSSLRFWIFGASALLTVAVGLPALFLKAQTPAPSLDSRTFVIRSARVFDGDKFLAVTDVSVENGVIKAVGKNLKVAAGTKEVAASGDTLLPGLIDSHTHTWANALQQALIFGVTTELDMFSDPKFDADVRKREAAAQNLNAADLRSSGTLVTVAKGHGTEYGIPIPVLASAADAQSFVDARIEEGSDYIKIIYDDGAAYGFSIPTLTKEELAAVITAAHNRKKMAVVHIGSLSGARDAMEANADGLAHIFEDAPPSADLAALARQHHTFVTPTLSVNESVSGKASGESLLSDARLSPYIDAATAANLKKAFPHRPNSKTDFANALAAVRALNAAGVPILAGTDTPNPGTGNGVSIHRELELLVRAGLTPTEALRSATSVPAHAYALNDRGRIAPGLRADLLLVKGDPATDINATRDIVAIWKTGAEVDRATTRAAVEKERQEGAAAPPAGSESGLISDFDDGTTAAKFGAGWSVSTDSMAGGKSTVDTKWIAGGAEGSKGALQISGTISDALAYAWAGAFFSPGSTPMAPVNLSSKKAIRFWIRGDGRPYRLMVFTKSGGYMPASQNLDVTKEWKEITVPFSAFGTDAHDITGILFAAGTPPGPFQFAIDNVRLE
jgi:imidazolonepropionase-like amidohydrolase